MTTVPFISRGGNRSTHGGRSAVRLGNLWFSEGLRNENTFFKNVLHQRFLFWFCTVFFGPGFSVYTVIWSMAFSGCHRSSFTSVQHKSPHRDLWPLIQPKPIKMLVLGRRQTRTIELKHFIMLIFFRCRSVSFSICGNLIVACAIFAFVSDLCVCTAA